MIHIDTPDELNASPPQPDNSARNYVTVFLTKDAKTTRQPVRCLYCGHLMMQTRREIALVFEGMVLEEQRGIETLCRRCKTVYYYI